MYIRILRNPEKADVMYLLIHEQINPINGHRPITAVACRDGENVLKMLLRDYWHTEDTQCEAILSRLITSALVALVEHPQFIRMSLGIPDDASLSQEIWDEVKACSLAMIHGYIPRAFRKI